MNPYQDYANLMTKSVNHIFQTLLNDQSLREIYDSSLREKEDSLKVAVEFKGTLRGEIVILFSKKTLTEIAKVFFSGTSSRVSKKMREDVAGELANLITGTFANQIQYLQHDILLSPPEINNDPIQIKALYDNINVPFESSFGKFEVDLFFKKGD